MRLGLMTCAALLAATTAADAAVLARAAADVDGDGAADVIRVETPGVLVVERGRGTALTMSLGEIRGATLSAGGPRGAVAIAATVTRAQGTEAIALAWQRGELVTLWRGAAGPIGRDGEHEVVVEATTRGLVRYQTRRDIVRCDRTPARLFVEGWDGARGAFRPVRGEPGVSDDLPVLTAGPTAGPTRSLVFRATAASTAPGVDEASALPVPTALDDGDPATVWREGRGGDGRGEFVTFTAALPSAAVALRIVPAASAGRDGMNRVARIAVVTTGTAFWIDVPDPVRTGAPVGQAYTARFPEPVRTGCVTVVLSTVHRGAGAPAGGGDTAIADLAILGDADLAPGGAEPALAAQVAAGGPGAAAAARVLARRGATGAAALRRELGRTDLDADAERRLIRALIENGDPSAGEQIAAQLAGPVRGPWAVTIERALARMTPRPIATLAEVLANAEASAEGRMIATRLLADSRDPAARAALVAATGRGPTAVRRAIVRALGASTVTALVADAERAGDEASAADLWRAAGEAARRAEATERAAAVDAMLRRLAAPASYELRYRLLAAIAPVATAGQIATLRSALGGLGGDARGAALRGVAAHGLGENRDAAAEGALAALGRDRDPAVRLAAIQALAAPRTTSGVADGALGEVLARDTWPELRRAATAALALRCPRPAPTTALERALARDPEVDVRGDALAALVTCKAPGVAARLVAVARDGAAPAPLRYRAVDLAVLLGDRALAAPLLALFGEWRSAALGDETALGLAVRAAVVLGRLGDPKVVPALIDAAGDPAFPDLQAAAATGLGELATACPASARATLDDLIRSEERSVALAAKRARALCGRTAR
jgi:hypothetical protein